MGYSPRVGQDATVARPSTLALASGTYDASPTAFRCHTWNQLILFCDMTLNTATSVEIKVEVASPIGDSTPAAGDWFVLALKDLGTSSGAAGIQTTKIRQDIISMEATGKLAVAIPICYKWFRVSAKTTGGPGTTTLAVSFTTGNS